MITDAEAVHTGVEKIGSHLAPMSQLDALRRVEGQYRSNNSPVTTSFPAGGIIPPSSDLSSIINANGDAAANSSNGNNSSRNAGAGASESAVNNTNTGAAIYAALPIQNRAPLTPVMVETHPALYNYSSIAEVAAALTTMHSGIRNNLSSIKTLMARKDAHFSNVKEALTTQLVEKRKREEGE